MSLEQYNVTLLVFAHNANANGSDLCPSKYCKYSYCTTSISKFSVFFTCGNMDSRCNPTDLPTLCISKGLAALDSLQPKLIERSDADVA